MKIMDTQKELEASIVDTKNKINNILDLQLKVLQVKNTATCLEIDLRYQKSKLEIELDTLKKLTQIKNNNGLNSSGLNVLYLIIKEVKPLLQELIDIQKQKLERFSK